MLSPFPVLSVPDPGDSTFTTNGIVRESLQNCGAPGRVIALSVHGETVLEPCSLGGFCLLESSASCQAHFSDFIEMGMSAQ